jgi:hypothetical protein
MGSIIRGMVIDMNETRLGTLEQLQAFVQATAQVEFAPAEGEEARYAHIEAVLKRLGYRRLGRRHKGLVRRYLMRTTGYSRQQVTRLVRQFRERGALAKRYRAPAQGFTRTYTGADVALLAETDALHNGLSGLATRHLMQRALVVFGDTRYVRGWQGSRWRTSTTFAVPPATKRAASTGPRPGPFRWPSGAGAPRTRMGAPDSCASTACTRASRTG